ncbi:ATP-binding protein [Streptomyces sp. MST-110588]|uniref:sensor histidine kinase n=1 Tax=Streptomyces sp. MST-110588 TaxID=2833628 RepID=UPI001F5CD9F7|nr:ATP-binding protein [Streptomyces sp. MST-110588]UNO41094.1 ATP-binding protein [Streptomyces sp. MST-110588]
MSAQISTRPQAPRPPLGAALLALPAALVVTGGLCLWAVLAAPTGVRTALAWGGGATAVLMSVAVTVAVYGLRSAGHHRERARAMEAEADKLADQTLPELVAKLRDGASVDTSLGRTPTPSVPSHQRIVRTLAEEVGRSERMRAAAMSACANAAGRVQALATSMLADLREMQHRHGEEVLGDLLKLDHTTAQAGRLADSIAVLTGARSGRRWNKPIAMESILRGAMGRISAYRRVRLHNSSTLAVAGHAAEGIMHALAEIMDNATSFSPPSSPVHVYVEEAQAGVVVTVEDSGLVMSETALRRAQQAVTARSLDLMSLSGTRLGLAVVGCLARKHGLSVSFRPSARGGTGVVVLIPQQLVTQAPPKGRAPEQAQEQGQVQGERVQVQDQDTRQLHLPGRTPPAPAAPLTTTSTTPSAASPAPIVPTVPDTPADPDPRIPPPPLAQRRRPAPEVAPSGLPRRRRGQTLASAPAPAQPPAAAPRPARSREESAARFRAFRQAVQGQAVHGAAAPGGPPPDGGPADGTRTGSPAAAHDPSPAPPEEDTR